MSCNVRQPDLDDGANGWEQRRDLLVDIIRDSQPDLIGNQELFVIQADYIIGRAAALLLVRHRAFRRLE
jgi:hypothetical protein